MYTLQPRFWELRIRRLPCGMIFPRPGLGVNKGRDVRGPFDKEQRKDEMSKDLRRIRTERRLPCKGLRVSHAYVQCGEEIGRRGHNFPKTKQAKSECEPRS